MKSKKNLKYIILAIALIVIVISIVIVSSMSKKNNQEQIANIDVSIEYKEEEEDTNWKQSSYENIELSKSITISKSGTYHLTGNIENGNITINAGDEDLVRLVLDNVNIICNDSSAINIENAKKVIIIVEEGTTNTLTDGSTYSNTDEPDACVFSKDDLVINGTGTLNINANYLDGITSKDDLKIIGTTINVVSNDDGIKGKDYVGIKNANIKVNAKADGIKSTNDTETDKGYIIIENSKINIEAEQDGIQAATNIIINNGTFEIESGDDGVHADATITINDGNINIIKSYEGIESAKIEINGGDINIVASDDGINVAGGNDSSSINGRPGQNNFSSNTDQTLTINNGNITIDATGDGIDINGNGYINGGKTIVNGPTNDGNGALDYAGTFEVSAGELIAIGASGMMQTPSKDSTIYSISCVFSTTQEANTSIIIKSSSNEEVISVVGTKTFNSLVVSSEKFIKGESYTVYLNGEKIEEITLDDIVTSVGGSGMQMPGGGMMTGNPMDKGQMSDGRPDKSMMH